MVGAKYGVRELVLKLTAGFARSKTATFRYNTNPYQTPRTIMTVLTEPQKKRLRSKGHDLKPVVMIGNKGLTESVLKEIGLALEHHELIKIKASVGDREERNEVFDKIVEEHHAILIQRVGNIALFFKRNGEQSKIKL